MDDIIKLAKCWERGGTVENPKWLLRELITEAERMRELDELGLYEERRTNVMSSAGQTTDSRTGVTTYHSDIRYDQRYVTPWRCLT